MLLFYIYIYIYGFAYMNKLVNRSNVKLRHSCGYTGVSCYNTSITTAMTQLRTGGRGSTQKFLH